MNKLILQLWCYKLMPFQVLQRQRKLLTGIQRKSTEICVSKKCQKNKSRVFKSHVRCHIPNLLYSKFLDWKGPILKEQNKQLSCNSLSIRNQGQKQLRNLWPFKNRTVNNLAKSTKSLLEQYYQRHRRSKSFALSPIMIC